MKKTILALAATLTMAASAAIAADLPSRRAATSLPVFATELSPWYVGVQAGLPAGNRDRLELDTSAAILGLTAGYEVNPFLRLEGNFVNRSTKNDATAGQMATANAIGQLTIPGTVITPYVMGGVGYGWNAYGDPNNGYGAALWNIGGGVRVALTDNWELDGRYRYVQQFKSYVPSGEKINENIVTLGVNYRF
jgi:opacity protein-like surface antigen